MKITKEQIQKLYGLAARVGILESGNKEDDFHQLVFAITKKTSVSKLTDKEYEKVRNRLFQDLNEKETETTGKITSGQIKKAWSLLYQIMDYSPREQTAGERMCGAIKKILGVDAIIKNPFAWLSQEQGNQLIEMLKRYLETEKKKAKQA